MRVGWFPLMSRWEGPRNRYMSRETIRIWSGVHLQLWSIHRRSGNREFKIGCVLLNLYHKENLISSYNYSSVFFIQGKFDAGSRHCWALWLICLPSICGARRRTQEVKYNCWYSGGSLSSPLCSINQTCALVETRKSFNSFTLLSWPPGASARDMFDFYQLILGSI